jgi:hypothetical protein
MREKVKEIIGNIYFLNSTLTCVENRLDFIFNKIDDFLLEGGFDSVDEILKEIEIDKIGNDDIIGILTITSHDKERLNERDFFIRKLNDSISKGREFDSTWVVGLI